MSLSAPNPTGKNQYAVIRELLVFCGIFVYLFDLAQADDPVLVAALHEFHAQKLTNNKRISELLQAKYNITMRFGSLTYC